MLTALKKSLEGWLTRSFPALELFLNRKLTHRIERVSGQGREPGRILFLSDLHLRPKTLDQQREELLHNTRMSRPELIVLGGDLVDSKSCLKGLGELVFDLGEFAPVLAIAGNHDWWFGIRTIATAVTENGGHWLAHGDYIFKGYRVSTSCRDADILVSHYPSAFQRAMKRQVLLTLAGHLHGCQFVFAERNGKLYPGAFFYRWNGRRFESHKSSLIVSLGCSDLLPVRWNCPRESVLIEIE